MASYPVIISERSLNRATGKIACAACKKGVYLRLNPFVKLFVFVIQERSTTLNDQGRIKRHNPVRGRKDGQGDFG